MSYWVEEIASQKNRKSITCTTFSDNEIDHTMRNSSKVTIQLIDVIRSHNGKSKRCHSATSIFPCCQYNAQDGAKCYQFPSFSDF